jgi:multifunctional 2-oxoglutarate metabolism enzyme
VSEAAHDDMDEVVIGMAHRGRLNVLTNIVGKSYTQVFREFEGNLDPRTAHGSGDVKYHLGAEGEYTAIDGERIAVSVTNGLQRALTSKITKEPKRAVTWGNTVQQR